MDLKTYQEAAIKTIKWRGTEELDSDHMIIGMFSEINEMMDAIQSGNLINIKEELGDMSWYPVNYATIRKIPISQQTDIGNFRIQHYVYLTSKLSDIIKKWMIYNKELTEDIRAIEVETTQKIINCICNFSIGGAKSININEVWDMNINKLHKGRYKDATYSDNAANNRDLEEEKKQLEK